VRAEHIEGGTEFKMADGIHIETALVVDDGAVERLIGKAMLEKLGFSVTTAASGEQALLELQRQRFTVVLCDIGLPGMDGLEVVSRLRAAENGAAPVTIGLSGYGQAEDRARAQAAGFDHYLVKPVNPDARLALVVPRD